MKSLSTLAQASELKIKGKVKKKKKKDIGSLANKTSMYF